MLSLAFLAAGAQQLGRAVIAPLTEEEQKEKARQKKLRERTRRECAAMRASLSLAVCDTLSSDATLCSLLGEAVRDGSFRAFLGGGGPPAGRVVALLRRARFARGVCSSGNLAIRRSPCRLLTVVAVPFELFDRRQAHRRDGPATHRMKDRGAGRGTVSIVSMCDCV